MSGVKVTIEEQEYEALIEAALLLADEDPYITKRLLFILSSYVWGKHHGG